MRNVLIRASGIGAVLVALSGWALAPDAPVADAAKRGDLEGVRALVREGADVNAAQGDGMTALHWAAMNGDVEMARVLIYTGAGVKALTRLGAYTPLHLASQKGHGDVVSILLEAGADANALTTTGGVSPLHFAAASGDVETVSVLIDAGAVLDVAEQQWGHTPLIFAAAKNRAGAIRLLLDKGADPYVTGRVIDVVQRAREDRERRERRDAIVDLLGFVPNTSAIFSRPAEPAEREEDKDDTEQLPYSHRDMGGVEQVGGHGGLTALTVAARDGNMEAALALLEGGADIEQVATGAHTSPLLMAALNGQFDLAMMLLERGADLNVTSNAGEGPLFATVSARWAPNSRPPPPQYYAQQKTTYLELMEALLKADAEVNARMAYNSWHVTMGDGQLHVDWMGATPFFRAAHAMDIPAMRLLARYGADPNIPTMRPAKFRRGHQSCPPLEAGESYRCGYHEGPDDSGSGPGSGPSGLPMVPQGGPGFYPIHGASGISNLAGRQGTVHRYVVNGFLPAVKYLVEEYGADVNARDHNADTPMHNAAFRGDNEMILYLLSKGADPMAVNRDGLTTVDKANGPVQRIEPWPETIKLLEELGVKNHHICYSC